MSEAPVLYEVADRVATLTLNRPDNRNSMTPDVLQGLADSVHRVREDPEVRCLVITGRGKSFCAGADFKAGPIGGRSKEEDGYTAPQDRLFAMYSHFLSLLEIEVPVIAAMQGHAIGGGLGLGVVCDIRVANREARYGANFVQLGLHPGMATTYLLPRLMGVPRAVELLLTGRIVNGAEAAEYGLANHAVEVDEVLPRALEIAGEIASAAPLAVRWTKESIYRGLDWAPREAARYEAHVQSRTAETEDSREGIAALLGRRAPEFKGR
ncbi:MAG: enoyl-CoA hydratase/isomerase family protein [Myxococcota bacterium]|jgi:enoyl-CoA hydratase/carnithine racemase|nr:enoyl-CoA hydratase/isomerase family protein [Myxococcota bacterium]